MSTAQLLSVQAPIANAATVGAPVVDAPNNGPWATKNCPIESVDNAAGDSPKFLVIDPACTAISPTVGVVCTNNLDKPMMLTEEFEDLPPTRCRAPATAMYRPLART